MNALPTLLLSFAIVPLAGCLGQESEPFDANGLAEDAEEGAPAPAVTHERAAPKGDGLKILGPNLPGLPSNFTRGETVSAAVSTFAVRSGDVCSGANACYRTVFTMPSEAIIQAELEWRHDHNDVDLYLYRDGALLRSSTGGVPGDSEALTALVPAGVYEVVVVAYVVTNDSLVLSVEFAAPPTPDARVDCTSKPLVAIGPISVGRTRCPSA